VIPVESPEVGFNMGVGSQMVVKLWGRREDEVRQKLAGNTCSGVATCLIDLSSFRPSQLGTGRQHLLMGTGRAT
jgi:hypothetical protein